jgi:cell division protein FtsW (lipid II flippase)
MIIAFCFLIPLLIYFALRFLLPQRWLGRGSFAGAVTLALASSVTVLVVVFTSPKWPEGTQIAWTGVAANGSARQLVVGGAEEEAVSGYPNGSFVPRLQATADGTVGSLDISGGGAFVRDDKTNEYLNGVALTDDASQSFGDYAVRLARSWHFWRRVEIVDAQRSVVASFKIPETARDRVYQLASFVERYALDKHDQPARLVAAEKWAAELRLLVTSNGALRVLDRSSKHAPCEMPCRLSLHWTDSTLPVEIKDDDGRLALDFLPPWRLASPIPSPVPSSPQDPPAKLTVTGRARPGDYAFVLPLGNGVGDLRQSVGIKRDENQVLVFSDQETRKQTKPNDYLPPEILRPQPKQDEEEWAGSLSRVSVPAGQLAFVLSVVNNLPRQRDIALLLAATFFCFFVGLLLTYKRMSDDRTRWLVYGLAACIWNLLAFRLLLALRYSLAPNFLDDLAVQGVTVAFLGLAVIPGLLLLVARLRNDLYEPLPERARSAAMRSAAGYLVLLTATFLVIYYEAPHLWDKSDPQQWFRLPAHLIFKLGKLTSLIYFVVFLYLLGLIFALYRGEAEDESPFWRALVSPLRVVDGAFQLGRRRWEDIADPNQALVNRTSVLFFAILVWFFVVPLISRLFPASAWHIFQEIGAPLLYYWAFAVFWLSSKLAFRDVDAETASEPPRWKILACALVTIVVPAFGLPVLIGDSGSVLATLAIFFPMTWLLLVSRPRRAGWIAAGTLSLTFCVAAFFLFTHLLFYVPFASSVLGETKVRLLSFQQGTDIQKTILVAEDKEGGPRGLPMQKLRNGYEHTRESQSIAHEGQTWGLGFGNAPARRSQIKQDTLQFDSVFSFFIASEYGIAGGICLLVVYAIPLLLILAQARGRFDSGTALAALVASAFLIEAILHAGMNLSAFPFTGRNLPLLSVNSNTDLPRWTIFFTLAVLALFSRYNGQRGEQGESSEADSVITRHETGRAPAREPLFNYAIAVGLLSIIPLLLWLHVAHRGTLVARDKKLGEPVGWSDTLLAVNQMVAEGKIIVDQQRQTLEFKGTDLNIKDSDFIEEERVRFNALPLEEKAQEAGLSDFKNDLAAVGSVGDYDRLMNKVRRNTPTAHSPGHVSLFRLVPTSRWIDPQNPAEGVAYRVEANPDFNTQVNFHTSLRQEDCPRTTFRDGQRQIIGGAWIMGDWVKTYDPSVALPWVGALADALDAEWKTDGARRFGTLSLDRALQESAHKFVAIKGRALFQEQLAANQQQPKPDPLFPPRVAISILSLPTGEVLALGGWPRMTPGRLWRSKPEDHGEWLPPARWIEERAPRSLEVRYGGDRNFDNNIVVGSSTKPLWASAVLAVHPNLDRLLRVRGADDREDEVFGIRIVEPEKSGDDRRWNVMPRNDWVDFKTYLAASDNRYQIRLGFLGLAERDGAQVSDGGASNSEKEALGASAPWRRVPQFPASIAFSPAHPHVIDNLALTSLAQKLHTMFAISVESADLARRRSFWTKDERDDLNDRERPKDRAQPTERFDAISPAHVNFDLDTIKTPRNFVSLLLGGGTNLWANVDLAAAFATCVAGEPVVAHVVKSDAPFVALDGRKPFPEIAARLREGLEAVVSSGTASADMKQLGALEVLHRMTDARLYAKTGTLQADKDAPSTSRIVFAIVRWDAAGKKIKNGLVFSVVGERAQLHTATRWLAEFIVANEGDIRRLMGYADPSAPRK